MLTKAHSIKSNFLFRFLPAILLAAVFLPALSTQPASAETASTDLNVTIAPVLSVSVSNSSLSVTAQPDQFYSASTTITADTNNENGYQLLIEDADGVNTLSSDDVDDVISPLDATVTLDNATDTTNKFPANKWGYSLNSTVFKPVPTSQAQLDQTYDPGRNSYPLTVATKVNASLAAGSYSGTIKFSLIANATKPDFYKVKSMQSFNSTVCNSVPTPASDATSVPTTTLTDARDSQSYTVKKLADGNCWMTENLRYGINTDNTAHSWNSSTDPSLTNTTADGATKMESMVIASAASEWSNTYTEPKILILNANSASSEGAKGKYGVLYNYCAASGGTVCESSYSSDPKSTSSICPTGWELPSFSGSDPTGSGATTNGTVKNYGNLMNAYGVKNASNEYKKIIVEPLSFVRAGRVNGTSLSSRDSDGYYWSSTYYNSTDYRRLNFYSSYVAWGNVSRSYGYSVRCVLSS